VTRATERAHVPRRKKPPASTKAPGDGSPAAELFKAAVDTTKTASRILGVWLIPLGIIWFSQIAPQFFVLQDATAAVAETRAYAEASKAQREKLVQAEPLRQLIEELGEKPQARAPEDSPLGNPEVEAIVLRAQVAHAIANKRIELPFGIKFEVRATFVPAIWCAALLGVLSYLSLARGRAFHLIARALNASPRSDSATHGGLLLALPWWVGPLPARDGEKVSAERFRAETQWAFGDLHVRVAQIVAATVLLIVLGIGVATSWQSAEFIEEEARAGTKPEWDARVLFGASLHDLEHFAVREGAVLLLIGAGVWAYHWLRPRKVPDHLTRLLDQPSRRRAVAQVSMAVVGASLVPVTNAVAARPIHNPRYLSAAARARRQARRSGATSGELSIAQQVDAGTMSPPAAVDALFVLLESEPTNLRLYDWIAALSAEHRLQRQLERLLSLGSDRVSVQSTPPPNVTASPAEDANREAIRLRARPSEDTWVTAILTGRRPRRAPTSRKGRRCRMTGWVVRQRRFSAPSFESLLQQRIAKWKAGGKWAVKWQNGGKRQQQRWRQPAPAHGVPMCQRL